MFKEEVRDTAPVRREFRSRTSARSVTGTPDVGSSDPFRKWAVHSRALWHERHRHRPIGYASPITWTLPKSGRYCSRRPARAQKRAGARGRAGAGGRQQYGDDRDRRHRRRDARARQEPRDAADQHLCARACGSARCRSDGWRAGSAAAPRFQIGTVFGVLTGLICCVAVLHGSFVAVLRRRLRERPLCGRASCPIASPPPTRRATQFKPKAISWVHGRRHCRRHHRPAGRDRHQGPDAAVSCSPRPISRRRRSRCSAGFVLTLLNIPVPPRAARRQARAGRCRRSRASRGSSSRSPAASPAIR